MKFYKKSIFRHIFRPLKFIENKNNMSNLLRGHFMSKKMRYAYIYENFNICLWIKIDNKNLKQYI